VTLCIRSPLATHPKDAQSEYGENEPVVTNNLPCFLIIIIAFLTFRLKIAAQKIKMFLVKTKIESDLSNFVCFRLVTV